MLRKVISGGQIGIDQIALAVAKELNLETGGWAPRGYRTHTGPNPILLKAYGLKESDSFYYPTRTGQNIWDSDATLIVAGDPNSPGSSLTRRLCWNQGKPLYTVRLEIGAGTTVYEAVDWLRCNKVAVLNVAGNRFIDENAAANVLRLILWGASSCDWSEDDQNVTERRCGEMVEDAKIIAVRSKVETDVDALVEKLGLQPRGYGLKVVWNKEQGGGCLMLTKNAKSVSLTKDSASFRHLLDSLHSFAAGYKLCRKLEVPT